ncbi:MAG: DNA-binding IclR family transcriptional regulator [Granulosicoccus sp.]
MSTVSKAIELLNLFSSERAEIRLSEFRRLTGRDKTTTYRHLSELVSTGLLEQDDTTRAYRMGPAVLRFSHIRELTVPRRAGVRRVLPMLADVSGETAHASILQGNTLVSLADHTSSQHSARVVLDDAVLPFHATASGVAVLAFAGEKLKSAVFKKLPKYTEHTITDREELESLLCEVRNTGFGHTEHGFELGVSGIAVPLFDSTNHVAGAVAIASVASRLDEDLARTIKNELVRAARTITKSWGGFVPVGLDAVWSAQI